MAVCIPPPYLRELPERYVQQKETYLGRYVVISARSHPNHFAAEVRAGCGCSKAASDILATPPVLTPPPPIKGCEEQSVPGRGMGVRVNGRRRLLIGVVTR